ncbi:hypothetical protein EJ08DRAFT_202464 [Tothia fuscella]|uniref:Uncharacterized protein n=1 Tax=Tothia fuscella TaxID=1048955 RepID=A0A9P4NT06_9PEZI|nr:hypothetical protein EJ08DRAFT_202464 [Tothia fuscella]
MRWTLFALPLLASALTLEQQAAQADFVKYDELKAQFKTGARRTLSKFGPFRIPANTGGKGLGDSTSWGSAFFSSINKGLCNNLDGKVQNCTMFAGSVGVQFVDGKNADPSTGIYIHHILSSNVKKRETPWFSNCNTPTRVSGNVNGITGGSGFLSTGEDSASEKAMYIDAKGTLPTGYHIKSTDTFNYWAQIVNYNKAPADVYVTFDIEWLPGIVGEDTKVIVVSATCGGGFIKMSQTGPANTTSGKFYLMEDGHIMGARGHMHDGASAMHMYINDNYVCASEAQYGYGREAQPMAGAKGGDMAGMSHGHSRRLIPDPPTPKAAKAATPKVVAAKSDPPSDAKGILTIASMTDCEGPWKVKKGDSVKLVGEYDLKKHPLRVSASGAAQADVMAMMGILFSPGAAPIKLLNGTIIP